MQDSFYREKAESKDLLIFKDKTYVSRGGYKIESVFKDLKLTAKNKDIIDIGASTGGFTDFLIKNGANRAITIDVGYGILAWKLRINPKITVFERTNIRYMDIKKLPFLSDLTTVDVSFISIKTIFKKILDVTKEKAEILLLLKPQFELKRYEVEKGGIIRNKNLHIRALKRMTEFISEIQLVVESINFSKIRGAKGNIEFWFYLKKDFLKKDIITKKTVFNYDKIIKEAVESAHDFYT